MKKYAEVFWTPFYPDQQQMNWVEIAFQPPKPLYPEIQKARPNVSYLECPAVGDTYKNDFLVSAPFDLNVSVDYEQRFVAIDRFGNNFFDAFLNNRQNTFIDGLPFLVTIPPKYLFFSHDDVEIEPQDVPILHSLTNSNFRVVRGKYNISKWRRAIDLTVEVIDPAKGIQMRESDPLFALRFHTPNNVPVKLTRVELTTALRKQVDACVTLKHICPYKKLKEVYAMAENYIASIKAREK